jgi:hypothetical protein
MARLSERRDEAGRFKTAGDALRVLIDMAVTAASSFVRASRCPVIRDSEHASLTTNALLRAGTRTRQDGIYYLRRRGRARRSKTPSRCLHPRSATTANNVQG